MNIIQFIHAFIIDQGSSIFFGAQFHIYKRSSYVPLQQCGTNIMVFVVSLSNFVTKQSSFGGATISRLWPTLSFS